MSHNMPRRRFLAAGAMLTAGRLLVPSSTAHALTTTPATDAELWAIINRPLSMPDDRLPEGEWCPKCETARRAPFTCAVCGFSGEPVIYPCECGVEHDSTVDINAAMLAIPPEESSLSDDHRTRLVQWQHKLLTHGRPPTCSHDDPYCAHGSVVCPVCGDAGDHRPFERKDVQSAVAAMLRDLHAALERRRR
jgi:hypothetical protein